MRKIAIAAAAIAAFATGSAFAAGSSSGSIALKGDVALACTVQVQDLGQSLNLVQGDTKKVGSITENCNSGTGYTISLSSANAGKLKAATGNATVAYSVNYDGTAGNLGSQLQIGRNEARFDRSADLNVTVPTNAQALAGNYSDTVTITIAAK